MATNVEREDAVRDLRFRHSALTAVLYSEAWPVFDQLLADRVGRVHLDLENEPNQVEVFRLQGEARALRRARSVLDTELGILKNELAARGVKV